MAGAMTETAPSSLAASLKLRVAEARVEDIGRAIARLPGRSATHGARAGDWSKLPAAPRLSVALKFSADGHEGMIQIDGTCRSNCGAGLQEQVTVARIDSEQAVAVRFSPLWVGAAPATIAPNRILEDLVVSR